MSVPEALALVHATLLTSCINKLENPDDIRGEEVGVQKTH